MLLNRFELTPNALFLLLISLDDAANWNSLTGARGGFKRDAYGRIHRNVIMAPAAPSDAIIPALAAQTAAPRQRSAQP